MDCPKEKRLEMIRAAARKLASQSSSTPLGVHRTKHRIKRLPKIKDKVMRGEGWGRFRIHLIGGFSTFEIPNHIYFEDYLPQIEKEMGERYAKKGPTALTKIAFAKQPKLDRVPPWQKRKKRVRPPPAPASPPPPS